jgi:FkbM family methyltransferase
VRVAVSQQGEATFAVAQAFSTSEPPRGGHQPIDHPEVLAGLIGVKLDADTGRMVSVRVTPTWMNLRRVRTISRYGLTRSRGVGRLGFVASNPELVSGRSVSADDRHSPSTSKGTNNGPQELSRLEAYTQTAERLEFDRLLNTELMQTYLKDCRWGRFLLLRGDMISTYAHVYGEWSELEVTLYRRLLKPDSVVIEVGANLGLHTVPLAKIVVSGQVICFEPQRLIFSILCGNLALNNLINVHAHRLVVGEREEIITIESTNYDTPWNYGAFSVEAGFSSESRFPGELKAEPTAVVALDEFPQTAGLERLDLLKVDTEGFELAVLRGADRLIARTRPILFVENNSPANGDDLIRHIRGLGYDCYWYCTERFQRDNYNGVDRSAAVASCGVSWNPFGGDVNMVCFPEGFLPIRGLPKAETFAQLHCGQVPLVETLP